MFAHSYLKKLFLLLFTLLGSYNLYGHGFDPGTLIHRMKGSQCLAFIYHNYLEGDSEYVKSVDFKRWRYCENYVRVCVSGETNCYFSIGLESSPGTHSEIRCTPAQEFYKREIRESDDIDSWVPAFKLKVGDLLLGDHRLVRIVSVTFIKQPLRIVALEIDNDHNYFVGNPAVLTHNDFLSIAGGLTLAFDYVAEGAGAGITFGPVGWFGGIIVGGIIGGYMLIKGGKDKTYRPSFDTGNIERYMKQAAVGGGGQPPEDPNKGKGSTTGGQPPEDQEKNVKDLRGKDFEEWLKNKMGQGARSEFNIEGRNFDGAKGNTWWEAKSGDYWKFIQENKSRVDTFQSDMGARLSIAKKHGANYELHSNSPIPEEIKQWLTKKGIKFFEY